MGKKNKGQKKNSSGDQKETNISVENNKQKNKPKTEVDNIKLNKGELIGNNGEKLPDSGKTLAVDLCAEKIVKEKTQAATKEKHNLKNAQKVSDSANKNDKNLETQTKKSKKQKAADGQTESANKNKSKKKLDKSAPLTSANGKNKNKFQALDAKENQNEEDSETSEEENDVLLAEKYDEHKIQDVVLPDEKSQMEENGFVDEDDGFFVVKSKKGKKPTTMEKDLVVFKSKYNESLHLKNNKFTKDQIEDVPISQSLKNSQSDSNTEDKIEINAKTTEIKVTNGFTLHDHEVDDFSDGEFTTQVSRKKKKGKDATEIPETLPSDETKFKMPQKPLPRPMNEHKTTFGKPLFASKSETTRAAIPSNQNYGVSALRKKFSATKLSSEYQNQQSITKFSARVDTPSANNESTGFELSIPQRKAKSGTKGRPITIETNHLALNFKNITRAVHYDVTIIPNTPKNLFRAIMEEVRKKCYKDRYPAFDGTKNLYSSTDLPLGGKSQILSDVAVNERGRVKTFRVIVNFAKYVDMTPLQKFMTSSANGIHHMATPHEVLQCLDIVLRSAPALTFLSVGRSYFTQPKNQVLNLGGGMEVYYGFYQSAIIGWKPYLNIDVAHKAFPTSQNVIDLIVELCDLKANQLHQPLGKQDEGTVGRFLRTLKIEYKIPKMESSKREYRVNGLEPSADQLIFNSDGQKVTVEKYFSKIKGVNLKYPKMPCLWVGSKKRDKQIYVPAELCTIVSGQVINKKLPEQVTSLMIKQTASSTKVRKDKIIDSMRTAQFNQNPCVNEFGITVSDKFTKIEARVLDSPALSYQGTATVQPCHGAWKPQKFYMPATLLKWTVVNLDRYARMEHIEELVKLILLQSANVGMKIAQPERPFTTLNLTYRKELQEIEELFTKKKSSKVILVIIPHGGLYYGYVKQVAELMVGCLTQCVRSRTLIKISSSTVINILQKLNAKLEGTNHVIKDKFEWMKRPYMMMGADVTHPSPDAKSKPSISAVTASHDYGAFKYNVCYRLQPPKVEIIEDLEEITREHLLYYYKVTNHAKPERIVFFRDGVSEGQFAYVLNIEIQAIRRACMRLQTDGTYNPKITFLVVQKRHHTRFFPTSDQDTFDKNFNVPVGTCVDTDITHPTASEFCLVSHATIQGVARPTKYRVLWDDNDSTEDELEQLSFYFCHMFARCSRSVSYPAPTYYAHLAATRITAYTESTPINLNNLAAEQKRLAIKTSVLKEHPMFFV